MEGEGEHTLIELQQKVRVISKKETGEPRAPRHAWPVDISGEEEVLHEVATAGSNTSGQARPSSPSGDSWLIAVDAEGKKTMEDHRMSRKPRIQTAPAFLRDAEKNKSFFEPELVSLGPYHRGGDRLAMMEEHKKAAAVDYAKRQCVTMGELYAMVKGIAGKARESYADAFDCLDDDAFANMMFLDGCFILHFIDCYSRKDYMSLTMSSHLHGFIIRDIFLLENQVPFVVLEALMGPTKRVNYEKFIADIAGDQKLGQKPQERKKDTDEKVAAGDHDVQEGPIHLLDLLRTRMLGRDDNLSNISQEASWLCFRSVMELKEAGIMSMKSETCCLRDVKFKRHCVHGHLHLPQIVVDDLTRPRFLNLIALEMCPDSRYDYGVTTYVCFLDKLIDHAEDVKELRQKEILLNALGSDQQVADLFNELGTGLSPDHFAYQKAVMGIEGHYKNRWRVSVSRMLHTHFSSPWTAIAFAAAAFLLVLTALQTFFTIFPKFAVH